MNGRMEESDVFFEGFYMGEDRFVVFIGYFIVSVDVYVFF